jgi:hypothetical protein
MVTGVYARLLHLANFEQPLQNLLVLQLGISKNGTSTLNWLDDFVAHITCERKTRGVGEYLHSPTKSLLRASCHAAIVLRNAAKMRWGKH